MRSYLYRSWQSNSQSALVRSCPAACIFWKIGYLWKLLCVNFSCFVLTVKWTALVIVVVIVNVCLPVSLVHSWAQRIFCPTRSIKTNLANPIRGKASTRACGRSRTTLESSSQATRSVGNLLCLWFIEMMETWRGQAWCSTKPHCRLAKTVKDKWKGCSKQTAFEQQIFNLS